MKPKVWLSIGLVIAAAAGAYYWSDKKREAKRQAASPGERGLMLVEDNGCRACHQIGNSFRAPELEKLYGREVVLQDGSKVLADEEYIREAILEPSAKISAGYQAVMPSYKGLLSEQEVSEIIEFTKLPD